MSAGDNSSSSTDESRSSTAPPPPPPPCSPSSPSPSDSLHPAREPFYQTVRRFSDMQFSTLLHSLIGLPSMIAPPSSTGWAVENAKDGEEAVGSPSSLSNSHRSHRSVSDAILEDAQKPPSESKEDGKSQNDDDSGGGGVGLSHTASKLSSSSPSPKANTANIPPPPTSSPQSRESRERMDIGKTTSVVGDINMDLTMVKDGEADEHEWSELDCYEFFEQLKKIERRQKQQNPER